MTTSVWSAGAKWGPSSNTMVWAPSGDTPSGRPVPAVAIGGTTINNQIQSASWALGPSDPFADLTPSDASFTFIGQLTAEPDDDMVVSTGWGPMWGGRVVSVSETRGVDGLYHTTVTATDKVGQMGGAALRKNNGKTGDLVEIVRYLSRVAGVRVRATDVSVGTYGLPSLQRIAYFGGTTFTGSMLEYLNIAARSSNAMVALQPDGSLRVMTREALPSPPTTVTLSGDNSPSSWTKTLAWGNDFNRWEFSNPDGTDLGGQSIPADILAHGERAFTVDDFLDVDTGSGVALNFLDWWAYTPSARWVVTDGQFVVSDLSQEELLTLAPLDWITVEGETWQVMSMRWSIDAPGQPMRLTITADNFLTVMSGIDPGPVISGVAAFDVTDDGATITWDLSEPGTGYVEYGTTTAYGSETVHEESFTYATHIQTITGLTPGTTYHYRVRSSAPSGDPVESISPDHTFETAALSAGIYGPGIYGDTLFNEILGGSLSAQSSFRFRAEQTAELDSVRVYTIVYHAGGYSAGDAGSVRCRLYADDETSDHFPTGSALATTNTFSPGNPPSTDFPLLTFSVPYAVTAGLLYHLVFDNPHATPASNYCSIDMMAELNTAYSPQQPRFADTDWAYLVKYGSSAWERRTQNVTPIADLTYDNGEHQGMGYMEVGLVSYTVSIEGNTMIRETFTVSGGDKVVTGVGVCLSRYSGTGDLSVRLETSGGSEIETVTFDAADVAVNTHASYADFGSMTRLYAAFASEHTLSDGSTYHVRVSSPSGTIYRAHSIRRTGGSYGFDDATYYTDGYGQKTTDGSTWTAIRTSPDWSGIEDILFHLTLA